MSANVESLFLVREPAWHGMGTIVQDAPTSADAINLAGLDWSVNMEPVYLGSNEVIPNAYATVRDKDRKVYGIVTGRYKICQNVEAFDFMDSLLGKDVTYETAGSLMEGKVIWLLAKTDTVNILGEEYAPYIVLTNQHDGKGAIKVACVTTRVVCQNTLNMALQNARRTWSTWHSGDLATKLKQAQTVLQISHKYNAELAQFAEQMAGITVSPKKFDAFVEKLFPVDVDNSRSATEARLQQEKLRFFYEAPDLGNFRNTGWGVIQAVADFQSHADPLRGSKTGKERKLVNLFTKEDLMKKSVDTLMAIAA